MTDTPAHTPLPWTTGKCIAFACSIYSGTTNLAFARQDHGRIDATTAEANAAFIVRACNSHYQLVAAAKAIMPRNLNLADWLPDDATIPLDVPVSELRALAAALSQAGGDK